VFGFLPSGGTWFSRHLIGKKWSAIDLSVHCTVTGKTTLNVGGIIEPSILVDSFETHVFTDTVPHTDYFTTV
jgi:hypothetical protein